MTNQNNDREELKQKPKELEWEKEFDSKFKNEKFGPSNYTHYFEESSIYKPIKELIKQTLTQQRTELLEEIRKICEDYDIKQGEYPEHMFEGIAVWKYIEQITNLLNKKNETK